MNDPVLTNQSKHTVDGELRYDADGSRVFPGDNGIRTAQTAFEDAMADAVKVAEQLKADGREDRLAGLAVACDLGVSAAFLFDAGDGARHDATALVRQAIAHATREETAV